MHDDLMKGEKKKIINKFQKVGVFPIPYPLIENILVQ